MTSPLNVPIPSISDLTNNAARLLQQSLAEAVQTARPEQLTAIDLELARSNTKAISFVMGSGLYGAYSYLRDFIARQAIPSKAEGQFLDDWLTTYKMPRKPASAAAGGVTGSGVVPYQLAAGTLLQTDDGRQYSVQADVNVVGGSVAAQVLAVVAGAAGNLGPGTTLRLVTPVAGIDGEFTTDVVSGISGGADTEQDADAVYRLQQRLSNEPMGGTPADYARWALQIPAITRAWGVRNPGGPTTAGVLIMADGNTPNGLPTIAQRDQVLDYIRDPRRGPPDDLFVIIPSLVVTDFRVALTPDTPEIRSAVIAALQDIFFREAVPGGSIPHTHAVSAIGNVVGEYNFQIISPTITVGDFFTTASFDQLLALGDVAFD